MDELHKGTDYCSIPERKLPASFLRSGGKGKFKSVEGSRAYGFMPINTTKVSNHLYCIFAMSGIFVWIYDCGE
ncbi:MAG: hypothetical protein PHD11_00330 [Bacteroidales bacterium]|nr:hypothetical protein [Bacteroidales bacterium]MDD4670705.1 hypothetical protein [Bacteroidales bacterium]